MRIWRDIPSQIAIRDSLSRAAQRDGAVLKILATVARYHALQKDLADNILPRFFALQEIATAIDKRVGGSTKLALKTALHFAAKLDDQDLTTLESLAKRARAKADYLDILKQHYRTNKDELADAAEFWKRVTAKQATEGKQIGLRPSVNLEKADPLHRSFEGDLPVVTDWWSAIVEGRTTAPLWLHLETTTLCQDPDTAKSMDTVPYMDGKGDSTKANVFAIRHIARLVQAQMNGEPTTWEWKPFDTGWIKPGMSGKSQTSLGTKTRDKPQLTIDRGYSLAYVWTGKKELFAALHNPTAKAKQPTERFHHSSFNSGGMVLCAGMIAAKQGLVTFLSNDSGHYKPDGDHLAKLAKFLHKRNLFHPTALIIDVESDIDYQNPLTVPQFLARPLRL
jgi:hypothetical protein